MHSGYVAVRAASAGILSLKGGRGRDPALKGTEFASYGAIDLNLLTPRQSICQDFFVRVLQNAARGDSSSKPRNFHRELG